MHRTVMRATRCHASRHVGAAATGRQRIARSATPAIVAPRMHCRALHTLPEGWGCDSTHALRVEFARARLRAAEGLPLAEAPVPGATTRLAPAWRSVAVPRSRLESLKFEHHPAAVGFVKMWGVGECRQVANCNPFDVFPEAPDLPIMSRRPGQGRFGDVLRGAYGTREFKYLWVLDHRGVHIVREMSGCKFSARGIATHSMMVDRGILGGEAFFDPEDDGKICVNFGSARLPIENLRQAEPMAEVFLSIGYETVVAMIPDREPDSCRYGMADRYGPNVQNVVFTIAEDRPEWLPRSL